MKKSLFISVVFATILFSCTENKDKTQELEKGKEIFMGEEVFKDITFQVESIPAEFEVGTIEQFNKSNEKAFSNQTLGLPADFINRDFLTNSVGYKDKLDFLVGMVVKKEKINEVERYSVILDFKRDSARVNARVPAQGILVEKKYDQKIGAGIQYLIASAEMERNSAFQILIADVSEVTIADKSINKLALFNTFDKDSEIDKYYIIRAAVTTSILYKKFTKMSARSEFNAAAIKVGTNYYSENSDLKQDWKIGMQLTPVKEFLKGFKPSNDNN